MQRLIDEQAENYQEQIQEIAGNAKGEADLINQMNEVKARWEVRDFVVDSYRNSKDRFIIKEVEEVITELEDDIMIV